MLENELYEPMRGWLEQYLNDKYKGYDIIAVDTSQESKRQIKQCIEK